ncbi:MAG: cyclic nucleotide-binding domain-containing protein [Actinobacteria bacterium]|nr:MAG: cyclic nucleotide-binding domain-containing protein [Actinomycetota bacterium]
MRTQKGQITLLSTVPLFEALNDRELELLSRRVRRLHAEPGDILVLEGQRGREFFVILSGQAAVMHDDDTVATLRTGDWFGELALLANAPRNATVAALTPMELFVLDDSEFSALLRELPQLARKLLAGMARRVRQADALVG